MSAYIKKLAKQIAGRHEFFADAIGVKTIAIIIEEAFEAHGIVQRLAERISIGGERVHEMFDPYQGYSPSMRQFAENIDLWTLEQVIVRVMTEIDRKRRKHLGGIKKMAERNSANKPL